MPAGSLARVAGYTIAGRSRLREGTLPRDRCHRGRVGHVLSEGRTGCGRLLRVHLEERGRASDSIGRHHPVPAPTLGASYMARVESFPKATEVCVQRTPIVMI